MTKAVTQLDLVARWKSPEGERLAAEAIGRLLGNARLDDLQLGEHEGRIDLRGISSPSPEHLKSLETKGWIVTELGGLLTFKELSLAHLDLSCGRLESLRLIKTRIVDCKFDDARCADWRLWASDVSESTFVRTDLRKAVLGPWHEGRGCTYTKVDFSGANLREIVCPAATFTDCEFGDAKLAKIDFGSTSFVRCRFGGTLSEVIFQAHGFKTGKVEPNTMQDVDFSDAELRKVEFRGLDLDRVTLPNNEDHLIVHSYRCVLERAVAELAADTKWRGLRAVLAHQLKWAGSHQHIGVFNLRDFAGGSEEGEAQFAAALLRRLDRECTAGHSG